MGDCQGVHTPGAVKNLITTLDVCISICCSDFEVARHGDMAGWMWVGDAFSKGICVTYRSANVLKSSGGVGLNIGVAASS